MRVDEEAVAEVKNVSTEPKPRALACAATFVTVRRPSGFLFCFI